MSRSDVFRARSPSTPCSPALESVLAKICEEARAAWPGIVLEEEAFVSYLAERLGGEEALADLSSCHAEDLWLACACGRGDARAIAAFVDRYAPLVGTYLGRIRATELADDVTQILLTRFFVSEDGAPKILEYRGRGALGGWVRVAAVRAALGLRRAPRDAAQDELPDLAGPVDPELDALKVSLRGDFERAFRDAFAALSPRDHTLLKLHYGEHVPVDALARLYRVHRVSVSRWLADARARVFEETRGALVRRLALSDSEFASVTRLVRSQLEVSIGRLFGADATPSPSNH